MKIGQRIQALRESRDMSRQALAERVGLDADVIGRIENDETAPRIATLVGLANALDVTLSHLFEKPGDGQRFEVVRREDRVRGFPDPEQSNPDAAAGSEHYSGAISTYAYSYQALTRHAAKRHMQPFLVEFSTGDVARPDGTVSHDGEEFVYILAGEVELHAEGKVLTLRTGDSVYLDAGLEHAFVARGETTPRALAVIYTDV